MPPELGLVCITASDRLRYRTVTRTRLLQFPGAEQQRILHELYAENLRRLNLGIDFLVEQKIGLYRLTSDLFPFADDLLGSDVLSSFEGELRATGQRINSLAIRLIAHPDQFVVLSSDTPQVIANSVKILNMHARTLDLLQQPRSTWAALELHGGKANRAERLVRVIGELPDAIRLRLALENDERAYSASDILAVCRAAGVPMVFDAHHHLVRERLDSYQDPSIAEMVAAARETWTPPEWQIVHISNGRDGLGDPRHHDVISVMPSTYRNVEWIEVEAKQKEVAIAKLRSEWLETS